MQDCLEHTPHTPDRADPLDALHAVGGSAFAYDAGLKRTSACPVHFVWDGVGIGRPMVRWGLMAIAGAGALWTLTALAFPSYSVWGQRAALCAVGLWSAGQVASKLAARRG